MRDDEGRAAARATHSIEAEQSVLGGLLLDNSAWDRAGDLVTDSDFYRWEHRHIFAAIGAGERHSAADVITVFEQLQSHGKAEECGGPAFAYNALAQTRAERGQPRRYAEIVRERAILQAGRHLRRDRHRGAKPQGRRRSRSSTRPEGRSSASARKARAQGAGLPRACPSWWCS